MSDITTNHAGKILDLTPCRIRQLIADGLIKGKQFGRVWLVDEKSVRRFRPRKPSGRPKGVTK